MAQIPQWFPNCVVALGVDGQNGREWVASGFLYGYFKEIGQDGKAWYYPYLVTNRHVFEDEPKMYLLFNPQADEPSHEYELGLRGGAWTSHPNDAIDVAVAMVDINMLYEHAMQVGYFRSDRNTASLAEMRSLGITEGDFVYVLGFPMGEIGERRVAVIVRSGSIARIRDTLAPTAPSSEFLVDAFVFPGNSGGPVVLKPEIAAIRGTKPANRAVLLGIVTGYLPYREEAVSPQTGETRVIFEENSGLATVHPVDYIDQTIEEDLRTRIAPAHLHAASADPETKPTP